MKKKKHKQLSKEELLQKINKPKPNRGTIRMIQGDFEQLIYRRGK